MKVRAMGLRAAMVVLLLCAAAWGGEKEGEGPPAVARLVSDLGARDWTRRAEAARTLRALDPATFRALVVPRLRELLRTSRDLEARLQARLLLSAHGVILPGAAVRRVDRAMEGTGEAYAAVWNPAVHPFPTLTEVGRVLLARLRTALAFREGGKPAGKRLLRYLSRGTPWQRANGAFACGRLGLASALPTLARMAASDPSPLVRVFCLEALCRQAPPPGKEGWKPRLAAAARTVLAKDPAALVRRFALTCLHRLAAVQPRAVAPVVPLVIDRLLEEDRMVAYEAWTVLRLLRAGPAVRFNPWWTRERRVEAHAAWKAWWRARFPKDETK